MERPFSEFVDFHPTFVVFAGSLLDRLMILPLGAQSSTFRANASLGSPKAPLSQKRHRKPQARLFLGQRRLLGAPLGAFAPKKGAPAPKKGALPQKKGALPQKRQLCPQKNALSAPQIAAQSTKQASALKSGYQVLCRPETTRNG